MKGAREPGYSLHAPRQHLLSAYCVPGAWDTGRDRPCPQGLPVKREDRRVCRVVSVWPDFGFNGRAHGANCSRVTVTRGVSVHRPLSKVGEPRPFD